MKAKYKITLTSLTALLVSPFIGATELPLDLAEHPNVSLIGGGLGSRMLHFGNFESVLYASNRKANIRFHNFCDDGDTASYRAHPGRTNPFAFKGGEAFNPPLSQQKDRWQSSQSGRGTFKTSDQWLTHVKTDTVLAFFGYNESFAGEAGLENFKAEIKAFLAHSAKQQYNGKSAPEIILVSPVAFDQSTQPSEKINPTTYNTNLKTYTEALKEIASEENVGFIDLYTPSLTWYKDAKQPVTQNGFQLNNKGYQTLSIELNKQLTGNSTAVNKSTFNKLHAAVLDRNWFWGSYFKIPNGVHVYGSRFKPYGTENYPIELKKLEEYISNRDLNIQAILDGKSFDLEAADAKTTPLPVIRTNYKVSNKNGSTDYLYGKKAIDSFKLAKDFQVELFASEKEFPNLANPSQMSFDNKGRLWVSTMPSYPHYQVSKDKPNDQILIYEDTNNDGKADKETVFAEGLHLPTGFEITFKGVYVAQGTNFILLEDTNNDSKADRKTIILSGFDDHDTHHVISAFSLDPFGNILMGEGTFIHSQVETAYGLQRSSNGGFFSFNPLTQELKRKVRVSVPNPWGIAYNDHAEGFYSDTSDPGVRWMTAASLKMPYGSFSPLPTDILENKARVRPTSGLEFISSRHFPAEMQGDFLINNTIGFRGTKQSIPTDGIVGITSKLRQDLITSTDGNYRPADLEIAPDGSLYIIDWHNVLVGHMQHSARDPLRDHQHGRIYRITHKTNPLVTPAKIHGASISQLLQNLKEPEYRTRYRTRRELRRHDADTVNKATVAWVKSLKKEKDYDHNLLEALLVTCSSGKPETSIHQLALQSENPKLRAIAVRALTHTPEAFSDIQGKLTKAAADSNGRVRMEAVIATSQLMDQLDFNAIITNLPNDAIAKDKEFAAVVTTLKSLASNEAIVDVEKKITIPKHLKNEDAKLFLKGHEVYHREAHCATCHQEDGKGLEAAFFPPLDGTKWVLEDKTRLIKLTMHGLHGPIEVKGKKYPGYTPMTAFKALKNDEMAAVLTYIRNSFGNKASIITTNEVEKVRAETAGKKSYFSPKELLKDHPHNK